MSFSTKLCQSFVSERLRTRDDSSGHGLVDEQSDLSALTGFGVLVARYSHEEELLLKEKSLLDISNQLSSSSDYHRRMISRWI